MKKGENSFHVMNFKTSEEIDLNFFKFNSFFGVMIGLEYFIVMGRTIFKFDVVHLKPKIVCLRLITKR